MAGAKPVLLLDEATTPDAALRLLVGQNLELARANEAGIVDDVDIECLHDYRVCLRRIRAAIVIFQRTFDTEPMQSLKSGFSALMSPTGHLRDLDVALSEKTRFTRYVASEQSGQLMPFFNYLSQLRQRAYCQVKHHLTAEDYHRQVNELLALLEHKALFDVPNMEGLLCQTLVKQQVIWEYAKANRRAEKIHKGKSDKNLHALRIQCKKLRYSLELFASLLSDKPRKTLVAALKKLQDEMGFYNDSCMQQLMLSQYLQQQADNAQDLTATQQLSMAISQWQSIQRQSIEQSTQLLFNDKTAALIAKLAV